MIDDGLVSVTVEEQRGLEEHVRKIYATLLAKDIVQQNEDLLLCRDRHVKYLYGGLGELPAGFSSLDASRPWVCYWILHSLALLEAPLPSTPSRSTIVSFLASCQCQRGGGFGGGPYQMPHLATTYAAVAALVTLGGADALSVVDTKALYAFFLRMCVPPERGGGMTMHEGGEVDVRGCYCALACCRMLCLDVHQLVAGCDLANFARRCQTGEGGLGGEPGNEAHGGYTFCGFAALSLAGLASKVDLERLIRWATRMQGWAEGGFMGRTCKLVDGCYSFWQGGLFPLLIDVLINIENQGDEFRDRNETADTSSDENLVKSADGDMLKLVEELISDASGVEQFVKGLHPNDPALAASARAAAAQLALDAAIDDSLAKEEEYMRAASVQQQSQKDLEQAKSQAIEALECAALIQTEFQSAQAHANVASCSATLVLGSLKQHGNVSDDANSDPMSAETEFLLYDARALQLWLLACCQAKARGGLRDKPGKPADYYHTCYCLSGLSSAQHATRRKILGGTANKLAEADRLCNVRTDKLEAARRFFSIHAQL